MPILDNDIKILASQVLADVPEGGGAATGIVVADGVSNNLFPDVSELDHVYGRVALRKVFASVQTASRDVFMGAHAIIADEPDDPGVSCLLFSTNDAFDTRNAAKNRIESYLIQGPAYAGQLFGDHIAGQMTVAVVQRVEAPVPSVGETLLVRSNEGLPTQFEQYLRVLDRTATKRTFTDDKGDFERAIVTMSVSDQLRADHRGYQASRTDSGDAAGKAKVYGTTVADAARYYGVKPLLTPVGAGDRTISADGIFVPLVPSSRTEVGIADARMNQQSAALQAGTVEPITITAAAVVFTAASALYIGGGILPGSLRLTVSGSVLTDSGGKLMSGAVSVGIVDYANGIASLATNLFGTGAVNVSATYSPCAPVQIASESVGIPVTDATRRLTWVLPVTPAPAPGSLQVSYRSQGRWYVLSEDGSGAVRGADASFGAGSLNFSTGTLSLTLGSLPDVPSAILLAWAPAAAVAAAPLQSPGATATANGEPLPTAPTAVTSSSAEVLLAVASPGAGISPGTLTVTWAGKTATDTGAAGVLSGDADGGVSYSDGIVRFLPKVLPPKGTQITLNFITSPRGTPADYTLGAFTDAGAEYSTTLVGTLPVKQRSFKASISVRGTQRVHPGVDSTFDTGIWVADDGAGKIMYAGIQVGTINYATGALTFVKAFSQSQRDSVFAEVSIDGTPSGPKRTAITGVETRTVTVPVLNAGSPFQQGFAMVASWVSGTSAPASKTVSLDTLSIGCRPGTGKTLSPVVAFKIGGTRMCSGADGLLGENPSLAAGGGTPRGRVVVDPGYVRLDSWAPGLQNAVTDWVASAAPAETARVGASLVDVITFRIAAAPVAPSGFSILGKTAGGSNVSGVANAAGEVTGTGIASGSINYETGVVSLRFTGQVRADSLRYNAVAYSYVPLDSTVLGLDPVRLPSDGRVPVFRNGGVAVIHHTQTSAPMTVGSGQTVNLGRPNVGQVTVIGANGAAVVGGYTVDRVAGTVTFTAAPASQPIKIRDRIEEAALMTDVQVSGLVKLNRPLSRAYPAGSKVSSALLVGDMAARVSLFFDQETWTGAWSDNQIGNAAGPTFDTINYPVEVQNAGAVTERWALRFNGSTSFTIIGEHLGQIGVGNTASDCNPINPATGTPYFKLDKRGFNAGWSVDNVLRLNTVGAAAPLWLARVVQQGTPVLASDSFTLAVRGDVDTP
ncbi:hypothetical protein HNP55_003578 [Paucibacter oligotrophus]|uniref:Uncharacterized protein n=1 Tax=Roseateles oligotrophus TaxID=1769250 RepID=A0A840LEG6_9BURK|nr:hypothetical protein [Roseateles oligotrophus]MBB4845032.1 hypothetical protein [Roseateles oligotrophus]